MDKKEFYEEFNKIRTKYHNQRLYFTLQFTEFNDYSGNIKVTLSTPWNKIKDEVITEHHFYNEKEQKEKFTMVLTSCRCIIKDNEIKWLYKAMEYNYKQKILAEHEFKYNLPTILLSNRIIHYLKINNDKIKCADCFDEATMLCIENDGHSWFYCGGCRVGG